MSESKVTVITGAARGIGFACAKRFAQDGSRVVLADIDGIEGEKRASELRHLGAQAIFIPCDVGDKAQINNLIDATVSEFGHLNCLIANAGIIHISNFLELEEDDFDRVIRVNLKGVFLAGQAAAKQMVAQGPDKQGTAGTIINMSSVTAVMTTPSVTPYVVAKGGVNQLTKVMAISLIDKGIRVNGIGPGSIKTDVFDAVASDPSTLQTILSRTPIGRAGETSEVASVAAFLASNDSSYIIGQTIYPDGGRLAMNYTVPVSKH